MFLYFHHQLGVGERYYAFSNDPLELALEIGLLQLVRKVQDGREMTYQIDVQRGGNNLGNYGGFKQHLDTLTLSYWDGLVPHEMILQPLPYSIEKEKYKEIKLANANNLVLHIRSILNDYHSTVIERLDSFVKSLIMTSDVPNADNFPDPRSALISTVLSNLRTALDQYEDAAAAYSLITELTHVRRLEVQLDDIRSSNYDEEVARIGVPAVAEMFMVPLQREMLDHAFRWGRETAVLQKFVAEVRREPPSLVELPGLDDLLSYVNQRVSSGIQSLSEVKPKEENGLAGLDIIIGELEAFMAVHKISPNPPS